MEHWVETQYCVTPTLSVFAMADNIRFIYKST